MTPKEKAKELFMDMKYHIPYVHDPTEPSEDKIAKECALIAVDELINCTLPCCEFGGEIDSCTSEYWIQVKNEIKRL